MLAKKKTSNYQRTLGRKQRKAPRSRFFWVIKLALFILRWVCNLIDLFGGGAGDD